MSPIRRSSTSEQAIGLTRPGRRSVIVAFGLCVAGVAFVLGLWPTARASAAPGAAVRMPNGTMISARLVGDVVHVEGWARDPDSKASVKIIAATYATLRASTANKFRTDIGKDSKRGFALDIPIPQGAHQPMCVAAMNIGQGPSFRLLGCQFFDVGGVDSIGNLEALNTPDAGTIALSGWALDPETSFPMPVYVTIDGVARERIVAAIPRADLAAAFPANGGGHGFFGRYSAGAGAHTVCVAVHNVGAGSPGSLGCHQVVVPPSQPSGSLDVVTPSGSGVQVSGWAIDPDDPGPASVVIVDRLLGTVQQPTVTIVANLGRADVAAIHGRGAAGFSTLVGAGVAGTHEVCAIVLNRGYGSDQSLGCATATVGEHRARGSVDVVSVSGSTVTVSGWAWDADTNAPVTVRAVIGSRNATVSATLYRPDVAAAYTGAGSSRGFTATISSVPSGAYDVCVTLVDQASPGTGVVGDRTLPCGSVVIGAQSFGVAPPVGGTRVGPPGGHTLATAARDGGISVRLRDNSTLWMFGDTADFDAEGRLRYFISGTGAWAAPGSPAVTRDAVNGDRPFTLVAEPSTSRACPADYPYHAMWPLSVVNLGGASADQLLVYLADMCLQDGSHFISRGVALADYTYDPAQSHDGAVIQLRMRNESLDLGRAYGTAAIYEPGSDYVYTYACDRPADLTNYSAFGPCFVARVRSALAADPGSYEFKTAASWSSRRADASPIALPMGANTITRYPPASFTIVYDPVHSLYIWANSSWPGFSDFAAIRVATSPLGPWSPPAVVQLPGCMDPSGGRSFACYAASPQPQFSDATHLGLGYYDELSSVNPARGEFRVVQVPFQHNMA